MTEEFRARRLCAGCAPKEREYASPIEEANRAFERARNESCDGQEDGLYSQRVLWDDAGDGGSE